MLDRLRQSTAGPLAKVLIGFLVISFALWGIGDVFAPSSNPTIAEIGDQVISAKKFRLAFQQAFIQKQINANASGKKLTLEQARLDGLDRQVLSILISQAVLEQSAENLGMTISEEDILSQIQNNPAFEGAFGGFDRLSFENTLKALNLTEKEYLAEQRKQFIRQQLITIFQNRPMPPANLVRKIHQAQNERRVADYVVLKASKTSALKMPNNVELKTLMQSHALDFMLPEQRRFSVLLLELTKFKKSIKISNARLRAEYQARLSEFQSPEKRKIQQIMFADKSSANRALAKMRKGASFLKIAKQRKLSSEDINLGWLRKGDYLSPTLEQAALKLRRGTISPAIETSLGWALLRVEKIRPASIKTFSQVHSQLRDGLIYELAQDEMDSVHDLIEDDIAAGQSFAEISKKFPARIFNSLLISKKTPISKISKNLSDIKDLRARVFSSPLGEVSVSARTQKGGYYWLNITQLSPERMPALKEVRSKAIKLWQDEERLRKTRMLAETLTQKSSAGASLKSLTKAKIRRTKPLARFEESAALSPELVEALFRLPRGGALHGAGKKPGEIIVARLATISTVSKQTLSKKEIRQELGKLLSNELFAQYIVTAKEDFGLSVNEKNLDLAFEQARNRR